MQMITTLTLFGLRGSIHSFLTTMKQNAVYQRHQKLEITQLRFNEKKISPNIMKLFKMIKFTSQVS